MNFGVLHKTFFREFFVVPKNAPERVKSVRLKLLCNAYKISYNLFDFRVTVAVAFIVVRADLNLYNNDTPKTLYFPILAVYIFSLSLVTADPLPKDPVQRKFISLI